jgi:hypothetical protein
MRIGLLVAGMGMGALLGGALASADQVPSASWFGVWKLNVARSVFNPQPPYARATRRIEPSDGGVTIIDDLVRSRGGILHLEWTGKFDGADYAVQGVEVVLTNAYRCSNERTCELVQKLDGDVVGTSRLVLSADGRTLTTVTTSRTGSATTVYEKQ